MDNSYRYSRAQLSQYFEQLFRAIIEKGKGEFVEITYKLKVSYKGESIFEYEPPNIRITAKESLFHEIIEILDRAGILPLRAEFIPAHWEFEIHEGHLMVRGKPADKIPMQVNLNTREFPNWLDFILKNIQSEITLVPDTNFLRRHYYSNHFEPLLKQLETSPNITIRLSRLTLLEIESKYNRFSNEAKENADKPNKVDKKENALKEKRIGFLTAKEVLFMRRNGASILPLQNLELTAAFSGKQHTDFADPLIRREIEESVPIIEKQTLEDLEFQGYTFQPNELPQVRFLFLTTDMMNAMTAASELLDVVYLSRIEAKTYSMNSVDSSRIASVLFNTAIQLGECDCEIELKDERKHFKLIGWWPGKMTSDWLNDNIVRTDDS